MEPLANRLPRDQNRVPVMGAVDSATGLGAFPLEINTTDGGLLVHMTNGGGGTQYASGTATPSPVTGNALIYDNAGTLQNVSVANPLPVSATLSLSNYALETGGNLATVAGAVSSSKMQVNVTNTSLAVTGTFYQSTQPVSLATLPALTTGSAIVGKVGIDQTTPGTTNNVSLSVSSGAGTSNLVKDDTQYGDGVTTGLASTTNRLWNGTNYDRAYGDKTNGAWVNVKALPALANGTNAIGTVGTTPGAVNVNQKTVNTTAVQLSASATTPTNGITVQALSTNSASVFVGGSGVTTSTGFELQAGQSVAFTCVLNTLYIISVASTTDGVCYNVA